MDKIPYAHLYTDVLGAMQILARGSNAAVFMTIGCLLLTRPDGANEKEIVTFTGLSLATVKTALANLQHAGLLDCQNGAYKTVRYIEYRKPILPRGDVPAQNNFLKPSENLSFQSVNPIKSKKKNPSVVPPVFPDGFTESFQELAAYLLLAGGINATEASAFQLLWDEHPDAALHKRALDITRRKAERPNYKYYDRVVRSGAVDYDAAKEAKAKGVAFKVVKAVGGGYYG